MFQTILFALKRYFICLLARIRRGENLYPLFSLQLLSHPLQCARKQLIDILPWRRLIPEEYRVILCPEPSKETINRHLKLKKSKDSARSENATQRLNDAVKIASKIEIEEMEMVLYRLFNMAMTMDLIWFNFLFLFQNNFLLFYYNYYLCRRLATNATIAPAKIGNLPQLWSASFCLQGNPVLYYDIERLGDNIQLTGVGCAAYSPLTLTAGLNIMFVTIAIAATPTRVSFLLHQRIL